MINYIDRSQTRSSSNAHLFTFHAAGRETLTKQFTNLALLAKLNLHVHSCTPFFILATEQFVNRNVHYFSTTDNGVLFTVDHDCLFLLAI